MLMCRGCCTSAGEDGHRHEHPGRSVCELGYEHVGRGHVRPGQVPGLGPPLQRLQQPRTVLLGGAQPHTRITTHSIYVLCIYIYIYIYIYIHVTLVNRDNTISGVYSLTD